MPGIEDEGFEPEFEEEPDGFEDAEIEDEDLGAEEDEAAEDRHASDEEDDLAGADEGQAGQPDQVDRGQDRSRGANRFERIRQENLRLKRQLQEAGRQTPQQPAQPQGETQEQRAQRLAMMSPEERADYLNNETRYLVGSELQQLKFQMADNADKTAFDTLCARNTAAAKMASQVEARLADMRKTGVTAPRKTVLAYLIGERALNSAPRAANRQQRQAADQRQRQQARPGNGSRSDVPAGNNRRGSEQQQRYDRLKDVNI